ncbi:glycosyltransferase [Spirosoma luteolum]
MTFLPPQPTTHPHLLFSQPAPHPDLRLSVVVPARNEAPHLPHALDALRRQYQTDGTPLSTSLYEVLLLLNNCTDTSEAVARAYQAQHPAFPLRLAVVHLPPDQANIGTARRLLMDAACRRLNRPDGIIASTDGDTQVDRHWIDQIRQTISLGNEVVGGRILTLRDSGPVRRNHLRDVTYRMLVAQVETRLDPQAHDPWPRHFQHFGASLALTCAAYLRAGGLPDVPYLEDEALYQALLRTDARIRKNPQVRVTTSSRLHGQVDVGFSEQLRYWLNQNQTNQHQLAEPAGAVIERFRCRQQLRRLWQKSEAPASEVRAYAAVLGIDPDWLETILQQSRYFGACWEQIDQRLTGRADWHTRWPPVPVTQAIAELRQFLRQTGPAHAAIQ